MTRMNKQKNHIILAIESSCDESAAAVIKAPLRPGRLSVLSDIISSQIEIHKKYGGVVPEIAAREHVLSILPVINEALEKAKIKPAQLTAIAVTKGPGLITSLAAGAETARALAFAWDKPLIEVNHIAGHIYSNFINPAEPIKFPALILTVSGGHTILLVMSASGKIKIIGETRDDAAGEAYDKAAKMMELGYPGGPIISRFAAQYADRINKGTAAEKSADLDFPRPMLNSPDFDFSFSGLKTSLLYHLQKDKSWRQRIPEYCYHYQQAIIETLIAKTLKAAKKFRARTVLLSGGVSANTELRQQLADKIALTMPGVGFLVPERRYSTDNAVMIGVAAVHQTWQGKKATDFRRLRSDASLQLK